jgi:hypothetical protein
LPRNFNPFRIPVPCAHTFNTLPQPQNIRAVRRKFLLSSAWVRLAPLQRRADHFDQVPISPVIRFHQGPEGDYQCVDVAILPESIGVVGHCFAEGRPFGGVLVPFSGGAEVGKPTGLGAGIEFGQVSLGAAQRGEVAGLGVGIETGGAFVPVPMGANVDLGIEPAAPAQHRPVGPVEGRIAGEAVLDNQRG